MARADIACSRSPSIRLLVLLFAIKRPLVLFEVAILLI